MKTKLHPIPQELIETRIFLVRGHKVMLGPHLAELYGIETRVLMQAVKRNSNRFPGDFMFPLTRGEIQSMSQFVTSLKYSKAVYV
ncbi:MAG: DNA-binding protein [Bacteroidetes bacterium]|nr:DNA-binding protein [Bacteroidota bacterium]